MNIRNGIGSGYTHKLTSEMLTLLFNPIIAISQSLGLPIVRQAQIRLKPETY